MGYSNKDMAYKYNLIGNKRKLAKQKSLEISINESNDSSYLQEAVTEYCVESNLPASSETVPAHIAALQNRKMRSETSFEELQQDRAMIAQYGWELHFAAEYMDSVNDDENIK